MVRDSIGETLKKTKSTIDTMSCFSTTGKAYIGKPNLGFSNIGYKEIFFLRPSISFSVGICRALSRRDVHERR